MQAFERVDGGLFLTLAARQTGTDRRSKKAKALFRAMRRPPGSARPLLSQYDSRSTAGHLRSLAVNYGPINLVLEIRPLDILSAATKGPSSTLSLDTVTSAMTNTLRPLGPGLHSKITELIINGDSTSRSLPDSDRDASLSPTRRVNRIILGHSWVQRTWRVM